MIGNFAPEAAVPKARAALLAAFEAVVVAQPLCSEFA
jgi:hypothetical protein